ncbi:MAG: zinc metallopeptidase, partial [Planctomycetota bacterium]
AMFFWDPTMILIFPALVLALWAQARVKMAYSKYQRIPAHSGKSGAQVAQLILRSHGIEEVEVMETGGFLADHYDPRKKTVNLSSEVYHGDSLASLAIAAHECGHALQDSQKYFPLTFRSELMPMANLGSFAAFPLFFLGFIFQTGILLNIGIGLFAVAVVFHFVTLPVEFNASRRAMDILSELNFLTPEEVPGARSVLSAAAWTYVASASMALLELVRLLVLRDMASKD